MYYPHKNKKTGTAGKKTFGVKPAPETAAQLYKFIPQSIDLNYEAEASFMNILFVMSKIGWFDESAWAGATEVLSVLSTAHPDLDATIHNVPKLSKVDFFELKTPRYGYADQK